ncbi:MAG: hypothetical protein OEW58_03760 [Gammaproteobacteria bacterium]|nr:hypothetical protein [Gammaproteobacteria bacterium]
MNSIIAINPNPLLWCARRTLPYRAIFLVPEMRNPGYNAEFGRYAFDQKMQAIWINK